MSNNSLGWVGRKVRHPDGRFGTISREFAGQRFVVLTIRVAGTGESATIELHSRGPDQGEAGWEWMWARDGEPEEWAPLGPHIQSELA